MAMLELFNPDVCYEEYCEHEFFGNTTDRWESIEIDEEDNNSPMFFIRKYEILKLYL